MKHDDGKRRPKPRRAGARPVTQREILGDCDFGDLVETPAGARYRITADLRGTPFGRQIFDDGRVGPFQALNPALPIRLIEWK